MVSARGLPLACGGILRRAARWGACSPKRRQAPTEAKVLVVRAAQHGVERMVSPGKTYLLGRREGRREGGARGGPAGFRLCVQWQDSAKVDSGARGSARDVSRGQNIVWNPRCEHLSKRSPEDATTTTARTLLSVQDLRPTRTGESLSLSTCSRCPLGAACSWACMSSGVQALVAAASPTLRKLHEAFASVPSRWLLAGEHRRRARRSGSWRAPGHLTACLVPRLPGK